MKERDIQTLFSKVITIPGVYELKLCKGTSLPYNAVAEHQIEALQQAQNGLFFHKISDQPWGTTNKFRFTKPKPFDCFVLDKTDAFVGVCFYKPRKKKEIYLIGINSFIIARDTDTRKSLTEEKAHDIMSYKVQL